MTGQLEGKVALVTGGGTGIGEAAAIALAGAGAKVVVTGRRKEKLAGLVDRIAKAGGEAIAVQSDVAVEADAFRAVEETVAAFGRLDVVVNSAGVNEAGGVETLPLDLWRKVIDINLMGTIYTCTAAIPHLKAAGGGDIINISSTSGRRSNAPFHSYATSKFGVNGFTDGLRQDMGAKCIRVCILEPGATTTEIADSITDPGARAAIQTHVTKDGAMAASDIADAILFVVSLPPRANVCHIQLRPTIDVSPM